MLTKDGDVRFGYLGLHTARDLASEEALGPTTDVRSVAIVLYRMITGEQKPDLTLRRDELLKKISDPLKRQLISRSLLAPQFPSAEELTRIVSELAPFDIRLFSKNTRFLIEVEHRAKAAAEDEARRTMKLRAATSCVMICNPGSGVDCESALVLLRALKDLGHVEPLGVIANMWPSGERARLLRGTLDVLGLHNVPVGVGSNGGSSETTEESWESAQSYITPPNSERESMIVTGRRLLQTIFEDAKPASITLLCTSSLKDAALFLRDSEALFLHKISSVVVVGNVGTVPTEETEQNHDTVSFTPSKSDANKHDMPAAHFVYQRCHLLGVPMTVISEQVAHTIKLPSVFYDELAEMNNSPIGSRLRQVKRDTVENAWKSACAHDKAQVSVLGTLDLENAEVLCSDEVKAERFEERDRRWFSETYCDRKVLDRGPTKFCLGHGNGDACAAGSTRA